MPTLIGKLSARDKSIFKAGLEFGQCYWDSYYGDPDDIINMVAEEVIHIEEEKTPDVSDTDQLTLGL